MKREKPKGRLTTADVVAMVAADPELAARQREQQRVHAERVERNTRDEAPVVRDLAANGLAVRSVRDLIRREGVPSGPPFPLGRYEEAIPVLIRWLPEVENPNVKEGIIRALSVPWAAPTALPVLVAEFRRYDQPDWVRWAIANALEVTADDSVFDDIVDLLLESRFGRSREMLAVALGNMRTPRAQDVLIRLLDDEQLAGFAVMGLGKLRAKAAAPFLGHLLQHPVGWIRDEARKALELIAGS
ncbi:MAG: HEAT repeat domain-containing protein [Bauldia sp.]|nr:HEAT repeat domain-containing protein [Bauldia sp.]